MNQLGHFLHAKGIWQEAEPLVRRALAIDEASYGPDHPRVATDLNNLARLLQDTNRLADAEPLMRRALENFLSFTQGTAHEHPHLRVVLQNYAGLLELMGHSSPDAQRQIEALADRYGVRLGNP